MQRLEDDPTRVVLTRIELLPIDLVEIRPAGVAKRRLGAVEGPSQRAHEFAQLRGGGGQARRSDHDHGQTFHDETIGSLNLFSGHVGPLRPQDLRIGRALTDVATAGLRQGRALHESEIAREQLQHALDSRVLIEQAKGVLSEREKVDMDEAFAILRGRARATGRRLSTVAREIIDAAVDG